MAIPKPWQKYASGSQPWKKYSPVEAPPVDYGEMGAWDLLKTSVSNIPSSAGQFAVDVTAPIHSPIETFKGLVMMGSGAIDMFIDGDDTTDEKALAAVGKYFADRYGTLDGLKEAIATDPVGILADISSLFTGGSMMAAKLSGKAQRVMAKIAASTDPTRLAARVVKRGLSPRISPDVKTLMDKGVTPTPGQALGGIFNSVEEKAMSIPIIGDVIKGARARGVKQLTLAAMNEVLEPIGKNLKGIEPNRVGLSRVSYLLDDAYESILGKVDFILDDKFMDEIVAAMDAVSDAMPKSDVARMHKILGGRTLGRLLSEDKVSGKALKVTQAELRRLKKTFAKSGNASDIFMADVFEKVQASLRSNLIRSNPSHAKELRAIDKAYANYVRLRFAFAAAGDKSAGLTPSALAAGVKRADDSVGGGDYARRRALMQDLSDPGLAVLGPKVPDSGTAGRLAAMGAVGGAYYFDPTTAALVGAASLPYIPGTQRAIVKAMTSRPRAVRKTGELLGRVGPRLTAPMFQVGRLPGLLEDQQ